MPMAMRGWASRHPRISWGESMPLRAGWLASISASATEPLPSSSARKSSPVIASASLVGVLSPAWLTTPSVAVLEALEDVDLVRAGVDEDGAVLGGGDVPLQPLEDQRAIAEPLARAQDVGVDLLHADLGVLVGAVVGDDHPAQAVGRGVLDVVGHAVLRVRGVLGVGVVVAGEPEVALLRRRRGARATRGGRRGGQAHRAAAADDAGRADAEQARRAQEAPPSHLRGLQGLVGDVGVQGGLEVSGLVRMAVVVPVAVVVPHVVRPSVTGCSDGADHPDRP